MESTLARARIYDAVSTAVPSSDVEVMRVCVWSILVLSAVFAAAILTSVGIHLRMQTIMTPAVALLLLATIHFRYAHRDDFSRLSDTSGVLATLLCALLLAGFVSHAGLRLHRPIVDDLLYAADTTIGVSAPDFVRMVAAHPWIATLLNWCYISALPLNVLVALALAIGGRRREAWELSLGFCGCVTAAALVFVIIPAEGLFAFRGLGALPGLPQDAGTYHLAAFHAFYDGQGTTLDIGQLTGVVVFPSFHVAMALVVPYGLRWHPRLFALSAAWSAMVIVSTLPSGGHYVIDVLAGVFLWCTIMATGRLLVSLRGAN